MSFLSRKPARPSGRSGDAGRDDEYGGDYDYPADGYQAEDENWSPGEYFSPEGIKGRWAGHQPDGRSGGRGHGDGPRRADSFDDGYEGDGYGADGYGANGYGRGDSGPDGDSYRSDGYGGYGADEYATGAYELPDGTDEQRQERGRRRRRDREDSGERTGIFRLRRDRGEDIWPDDGISDEDYWASVAADRPLNGANPPLADDPLPRPAASGDSRSGGERGPGRLGPAPGLAAEYKPASGRPSTGPTPTVGVTASRPPTGPTPAWQGPARSGAASGGFQAAPTGPRPSFQPSGYQGGGPAGPRPQDRGDRGDWGDWGERTERIERVNAAGYPEPRPSPGSAAQRSSGPMRSPAASAGPLGSAGAAGSRSSGPMRSAGAPGSLRSSGPLGSGGSQGRGRGDTGRGDAGRGDTGRGDAGRGDAGRGDTGRGNSGEWRALDRHDGGNSGEWRALDRHDGGRDLSGSGAWPAQGRGGEPARSHDDPLTSTAFSRFATSETDGRSYRVAARRSQAQAKLTEHTETFITGGQYRAGQHQSGSYQSGQHQSGQHQSGPYHSGPYQSGQYSGEYPAYPAADQRTAEQRASEQRASEQRASEQRTGEYRQFRGDVPAAAGTATPGGRYPAPGGQPGQPPRNSGRVSLPGTGGFPAAPGYEPQQRGPQQRPQGQHRQSQLPPATASGYSAGGPGNAAPAPLSAPVGGPAAGPSGPRMTASGGLNPYDSAVTGSYPYPGQPFPARPAPAATPASGSGQDSGGGRYYRPPADGYPAGSGDQGRPGYGSGGAAPRDERY